MALNGGHSAGSSGHIDDHNLIDQALTTAAADAATIATGRLSEASQSAAFATKDKGDALMAHLDQKANAVLVVLGDSTGLASHGDWPAKLGTSWATRYPTCAINERIFSGAAYAAPVVLAGGTTTGTVAQDTFTRSGELIGSVPNAGTAWTGPVGKYTLDGTKATFAAGTASGTANKITQTLPGRATASLLWTLTTDTNTGNSTWNFLCEFVDSSNFLWTVINTIGSVISFKQGATVLGTKTFAEAGITVGSATPQTVNVSIAHVGTQVTFTCGTASQAFILSGADDTLYAGGNQAGFWGIGPNAHSVDNFLVTASTPVTNSLTIYNGSVGSTLADYPLTRIAAMIPVTPDAVIVNYSHNHLQETPATFEAALDTLVAAIQATYPAAPIIISGQNPQYPPTANPTYHNARQGDLRRYARAKGFGYLPVFEAFISKPDPQLFIESADGVHPTMTGPNDGSVVWELAAEKYLNALSLTP